MYINLKQKKEMEEKYLPLYLKYNRGLKRIYKRKIIKNYENLKILIKINNEKYLKILEKENNFLNMINGFRLDNIQKKVVLSEEENTLVIAGAGSGKTLTLLARVIYLIKKGVSPNKILCLTLTNSCANNLSNKLRNYNINLQVLTFHKLGMLILKKNGYKFTIATENELSKLIDNKISYKNISDLIPEVKFKVVGDIDEEVYIMQNIIFKESVYYFSLKQTILCFINLFKNNNYNIDNFEDFLVQNDKEKNKYKRLRNQKYLLMLKDIYETYDNYLDKNNKIDFNDMINKASKVLKTGIVNNYEYIIVDEYQDTSLAKCFLLKNLQLKTNAKILAIGDDWQSIYRFTGTNLKVFTDFSNYFPYTKIFKLNNTYRNSNELFKIMNKFIMKNKKQISKNLISFKHLYKPILVFYYENNQTEVLDSILKEINQKYFILGRNNNDINIVSKKYQKHFITVHKAKGLESDISIIINLEDSNLGFPNKIVNDDILKYVSTYDDFPFEEERRLFYVALTRTKSYNILLVNKNNPSIFANEIIKENKSKIIIMECPKCKINLVKKDKNMFVCKNYPKCKYKEKLVNFQ